MANRSDMEIKIAMLRALKYGEKLRTHLMYAARINWKILNKKLDSLEALGLVVTTDENHVKITPAGFDIIGRYEAVAEVIDGKNLQAHRPAIQI